MLLLSLNVLAALTYASSARPFVSEALYDGLLWVSENTPRDSVILAWWDYSGPIVAIADRRSVAHTAPSGIMESFSLLLRTSNETKAVEIFKSLNEDFYLRDMRADYLIVDTRTYLLWPKVVRFEPYVNQVRVENRELSNSMLHRLYVAKNLSRFRLVYANQDFRLYRAGFNYTKIVSVETERYHRAMETITLRIKTASNEVERPVIRVRVLDPRGEEVFRREIQDEGAGVEVEFSLPDEAPRGGYVAQVEAYAGGVKRHSMRREFFLI